MRYRNKNSVHDVFTDVPKRNDEYSPSGTESPAEKEV